MNDDPPAYRDALRAYGKPDPTQTKLDTSLEACRVAGRVETAAKKGAKL
jgi:hypothetical protein